MSVNIPEIFACNVFNEEVMKTRLPKNVYKALKRTMQNNEPLADMATADVVANTIKEWAIERGATHYTHWFQPMTGSTAEKHDCFINPAPNGMAIMEFSGKALVKGEPDASSFPSGGLRRTSTARGYTAWDPTSYCFVKEGSLYIPTVFVSYTGEVLDKKTPLLRSMQALSKTAVRFLKLFGNDRVTRVTSTVGAEQEYFLIDKKMYDQREDIILTGRTLFGAKPPKGQDLDDQYFANLRPRIAAYMADLDEELWKLGIYSKTKHNEVAPAQHEMAPIFTTSNLGTDQNELAMEVMEKVALKHGLVCLLHEKPFEGVNGSGKHNNWSMSTNDGQNLLDPGDTPMDNLQFLTILCALIKGVDEYADLMRLSAASAGNDHRLGADEAPPAIVSMFLGEELEAVLQAIEDDSVYKTEARAFKIGVDALPSFPKDSTDRNRTSPFAFTGNRFEFRMVGSSDNIACPNVLLNTIVCEELSQFTEILEPFKGKDNFDAEVRKLLKSVIKEHRRIIFNGDGYSPEWVKEAERRGLPNYASTVDCMPHYTDEKNVRIFRKFEIYNLNEVTARKEIHLEKYSKTVRIEARTMVEMARKQLLPATMEHVKSLCDAIATKKQIGFTCNTDEKIAKKLNDLADRFYDSIERLDQRVNEANAVEGIQKQAEFFHDVVLAEMDIMRSIADEIELNMPSAKWPIPCYSEIIYNV
ncbi:MULTISPECIES: glutamine synthetase III [Ruminococcus]|uniref:Glutamine synthetase n=1 Tax=Ruminococcus flavefaciens TaxID=1265 RepID=A0A315XV71_RUMFL|nr:MULTISPECIES: glutamine synthetase III [Ruminococcus]MBQ6169219.1 glutamine synthetase III [Ruminococcus sp.]MBR1432408.1 glutamine synthetase III [Ruminococcus sp.]PWJ10819.1 glutamine synthetase [Ruminococcus flavefaciens]SSA51396.1 glutamine synthetase [Ruminococcus flavefaciens]